MVVPYRFVPPANGGHQAAFGFCEFLAREMPLVCISTTNNEPEQAPFPMRLLFEDEVYKYANPLLAWRCFRLFRKEKIDVCITHQPFIAPLLLPVTALLGISLHIYVQNLEYRRFRSMGKWFWPIVYAIEWITFKLAGRLYFISPDELEPGKRAFGLKDEKCSVVPFGTRHRHPPEDIAQARRQIRQRHGYGEKEFLIIFFGPQSYQPNLEAVELIIHHINPLMQEKADFPYRFLICGGGLPGENDKLNAFPQVDYLGFVPDIEAYVKAADVMINPVNTGGGVKTKLVEAIALGKTVVSSRTGALGVGPTACGEKLLRIEDEDYPAYCEALIRLQQQPPFPTPPSFYERYYWKNVIKEVVEVITPPSPSR